MKKLLSTLFLIVVVMQLHAQLIADFTVNTAEGVAIPYRILTGTDKQLDASVNEVGVYGKINSPATDVVIPSTVTYGGVTYTVSCIFNIYDSHLKSLTFPPTIHKIMHNSFEGVTLKELHIPTTITEIEGVAFYLAHIQEIWLPTTLKRISGSSVFWIPNLQRIHGLAQTQLEYIADHCFLDWYMGPQTSDLLNDLAILPPNIKEIGDDTFTTYNHGGLPLDELVVPASMQCIGIRVYNIAHDVYIKGANPFTLGMNAFGTQSTLKVHVPADCSVAFKAAADWVSYADKVIEDVKIGATGYTSYYLENENFLVPAGCTAYIITGTTPSGNIANPDQAVVKAFTAGKIIPKKTGFILQGPASSTVAYQANVTGTEESVAGNYLVGTATEQELSGAGYKYYVLANGDQGMGFYSQGTRGGASIKLGAHHAGLRLPAAIARAKSFTVDFESARQEAEATGISTIEPTKQPHADVIYDLQGRRVVNPTHGIYIINGKKVIK
ncbi:MAG: leucine-rich repeat domain-containing protein [Prevotella pallens]|nr:leucine-rich repeat domain-containing protein [Prevotella pallens]